MQSTVIGITIVLILGMTSQWMAWKFKIPSILMLLALGIFMGPVTGIIAPEAIFGKTLFSFVSIAVAIILFEGGLELKFSELSQSGTVIRNLVSIGALVTWVLSTLFSVFILGLSLNISLLLGAILVVTGPTVVGPLLRHLRPVKSVSSVLKWEGIVIDPIGALLAVLVFEFIISGTAHHAVTGTFKGVFITIIVGCILGSLGGFLLILMIKRYWLPDFLQSPVSLMMVIAVFAISNLFQHESGLFSVTLMGVILANQKWVSLKRIAEFKESLRILLISSLFIVLAARLTRADLATIDIRVFIFICLLIFVVRPLAVFASTIKSNLSFSEKLFISWMAPRGIVAAAVASIFSFELISHGHSGAERIAPITFSVIIATVIVYSLTSGLVLKKLQLASPKAHGVLIMGAHHWARLIALALKKEGFRVILYDTNYSNVTEARVDGLEAYEKNLLTQSDPEEMDLDGIGKLFALTPNDEVNSLAAMKFSKLFSEAEVYQLPFNREKKSHDDTHDTHSIKGRFLLHENADFEYVEELFVMGAIIKKTTLSKEFSYEQFLKHYGKDTFPIGIINTNGELLIHGLDKPLTPKTGQTLISITFASVKD